jgi:hypothetical protein
MPPPLLLELNMPALLLLLLLLVNRGWAGTVLMEDVEAWTWGVGCTVGVGVRLAATTGVGGKGRAAG